MSTDPTATLLLAAHGAGDAAPINRLVRVLAARLAAGSDLDARVGFKLGTPDFALAASRLPSDRPSVVVPLMTSDGYFVRSVLPGIIERAAPSPRLVTIAPPLGLDPRVHDLLLRRAAGHPAVSGVSPPPLLVVGHGTSRSLASATSTYELVASLRDRFPRLRVRAAFLDQAPSLEDAGTDLDAQHLLVLPFLLGGGPHVLSDIPERLTTARTTRVDVLDPLAASPALAEIVRSIARATLTPRVLRLGTRASPLALWQARHAAKALEAQGVSTTIVPLSTEGDRDQSTPLESMKHDGVFTDDLARALHRGEIDAAVHSLKDLPLASDPALALPAMLPRAHASEVLVARGGLSLDHLPHGAIVGTCSLRRSLQLRAARPDLNIRHIRGTIQQRVDQVHQSKFDATILARAGLERLGLLDYASQELPFDLMLPEAGQSVIAIQTRRDDWHATSWIARADDPATRLAALAERAFAAAVETEPNLVAAAHAEWSVSGGRLHTRVLSRDGTLNRGTRVKGADPFNLADRAAAELSLRTHSLAGVSP
jgi:hydroxymethylbilane synthase